MVGTLGYMAPEQIEIATLSAATDLYAFGVVWFEMLTGRLPFVGETPAAVAVARLHVDPVPPSTFNQDVPKWIDEAVLRCLGRHRANRFASAEEVLQVFAANAAETSTGPTKSPASRPFRSGRRTYSVGATVLLVSTGLGYALLGQIDADSSRRVVTRSASPEAIEQPSAPLLHQPVAHSPITVTPVYTAPVISGPTKAASIVGNRASRSLPRALPAAVLTPDRSVAVTEAAPPPPDTSSRPSAAAGLPARPTAVQLPLPSAAVSSTPSLSMPDWLPP